MRFAVGFDFDHTLGVDNKLERVAFLRLLERLATFEGAQVREQSEEIAHIDELLVAQRSGAFPIDEAVHRFMQAHGVDAGAARYVEYYKSVALSLVDELVEARPGLEAMLEELHRRGVPCAVLTNGWSPLQQRKAARAGFLGPVIASDEIGVQKPDPRAFERLVEFFGYGRAAVWYVGDNPAVDVAGARTAGLQAIWFDEGLLEYPADLPRPDAVVRTLPEVLDVLPGAAAVS